MKMSEIIKDAEYLSVTSGKLISEKYDIKVSEALRARSKARHHLGLSGRGPMPSRRGHNYKYHEEFWKEWHDILLTSSIQEVMSLLGLQEANARQLKKQAEKRCSGTEIIDLRIKPARATKKKTGPEIEVIDLRAYRRRLK